MTGPESRRKTGMWVALAIAVVVALGLFGGAGADVTDSSALRSEVPVPSEGTIVVRVLGPVLY